MTKITTTIDGIHGTVKIVMDDGKEKQAIDLKWCLFDDKGMTGFITSLSQAPVLVTELAAEHFIRMVVASLVRTLEIKPGDLSIINHLGDNLPDVQFLPPTFKGNESDIHVFVSQQDSLLKLHAMYDEEGSLNAELIQVAEDDGILEDFLSLVQIRASGFSLSVRKPSQ